MFWIVVCADDKGFPPIIQHLTPELLNSLMILFSKILGLVVKKPEDYYEKDKGNS